MFASFLIIGVSLVLMAYWFRCTCLLLLEASPGDKRVAALSPPDQARSAGQAKMDPLHQALERDFALVAYLLRHAAGIELDPLERHMLTADYRLMRLWYRVTRSAFPARAESALREMASVVGLLTHRLSQQSVA